MGPAPLSLADYFNGHFAHDADPWRSRTSWYEARKRALTLASLPRARYRRAFEPGCAGGELSAALAPRCDRILCADFAPRAVEIARSRLAPFAHAHVERRAMPDDWPTGRFDLIVVSEIAYYLGETGCMALATLATTALEEDGTLLCCHWRHGGEAWMIDSAQVHAIFAIHARRASLRCVVHAQDADFLLDVWSANPLSVARRERAG
ncbi:nodulation S family protein [Paraburkholderia sp. CNPSo 3274]|uniref:SAM-dependent methyltransferase n=1 Tax=Paraburkholderia sp. CNPSo 3274 TaxID=2940932 RepID=UPI0020B6C278|nr:SAM-dependent methyltransferase [Paraburkholderia sp. CNPSo 3274]MCP3712524.1 nodulation S family protein [Paraburkholderia sp. CNPSo 3274]